MIRKAEDEMWILRLLVAVIVVIAAAFLLLGYLGGSAWSRLSRAEPADRIETSDTADQARDAVERARQRGAEIGEKAAVATSKVEESLGEAALTAKIKAKMALDDMVKARAIDVTTRGTIVTLSGTVESRAERERAVSLARDTEGVTRVVDELRLQ
jgi:osmotically-inducible protein OsmY